MPTTRTIRRSPRYRVVADSYDSATLYSTTPDGRQVVREFRATRPGSYVYEIVRDRNETRSVCAGLALEGNCLAWGGTAPLADLIRREICAAWRERDRRERREREWIKRSTW